MAVGAGACLGIALALRRRPALPLLAVVVVGLGLWRGAAVLADQAQPWATVPNTRIRVLATVDAPVETRGANATVVARIDAIDRPTNLPAPTGRIQAIVPALPAVQMGDTIEVEGRFHPTDPTNPRERRLLANGIIATSVYPSLLTVAANDESGAAAAMQRLRSGIEATIGRMLPEPQAALLVGLMIGSGGGMPDDFRTALVAAGLTHVVIASGYNVTLVAGALRGIVRPGSCRSPCSREEPRPRCGRRSWRACRCSPPRPVAAVTRWSPSRSRPAPW
jgi:predicted membrane metal-binding protein